MEEEKKQLQGVVETVIFENPESGYAVFELAGGGERYMVCGEVGEIHPGETVTCIGRFEKHPNYGEQFRAESCHSEVPQDEQAIYLYLASGSLPYIGVATARKLIQKFGTDTLRVIAEEPEKLTFVRTLNMEKARRIQQEFQRSFGIREAITFLAQYGIGPQKAVSAYRTFGGNLVELIQKNPYLLCGEPLHLSFGQADAIAEGNAIPEESTVRLRAALLYTISHNAEGGHTCLPVEKLVATAAAFLRLPAEMLQQTVEEMIEQKDLVTYEMQGRSFVFLPDLYLAEEDTAFRIGQLCRRPKPTAKNLELGIRALETTQGFAYAPLQREAICKAMTENCMILTGGPGTGKTTAINAILALLEQQAERVLLCAPTGRAAKHLADITDHKASTIHRLLEVDYTGGEVRFIHNEHNLLRGDVLILDEMSMVDSKLFQSLLCALRPSCRLIMVGDTDQLPSVGPGNVLGELIASGIVPTVRLTSIFRQAASSKIVENAHGIIAGQVPKSGDKNSDFFFMERGIYGCRELICDLVAERLPKTYGFHPVRDIQVLCPSKIGEAGTERLNPALQQRLNPPDPAKPEMKAAGQIFRLGDKVMQIKNNYDILFEREGGEQGVGAYNGDIGVVTEVDLKNRAVRVQMDDKSYLYPAENLAELTLAYAITIHKSQGSEFPAVVLPCIAVPERLRYRNLLYTGLTRARKLCVLPGESPVVAQMAANNRRKLRYSALGAMLCHEME